MALGIRGPQAFSPTIAPAGSQEIRYVNSVSGNDNSDGLTAETAWASLVQGREWQQRLQGLYKAAILELSGSFV